MGSVQSIPAITVTISTSIIAALLMLFGFVIVLTEDYFGPPFSGVDHLRKNTTINTFGYQMIMLGTAIAAASYYVLVTRKRLVRLILLVLVAIAVPYEAGMWLGLGSGLGILGMIITVAAIFAVSKSAVH